MKALAGLLNEMRSAGVIRDYALFGATAQMRYTEAVATLDADVLVDLPETAGLDVLRGVYEFCAGKGLRPEGEAIRVGWRHGTDWPRPGRDSRRGSWSRVAGE